MRPVSVFATVVDTGTYNGFNATLGLIRRRHEAHELPPPVSITFVGTRGVVVQFAAQDRRSVRAWASAFGLPAPEAGYQLQGGMSGQPCRLYGTRGTEFRLGIEVWCLVAEDEDEGLAASDYVRAWARC